MKAIISTTYADQYLFCLPIVTWCWNKLGVDVICFMPELRTVSQARKDTQVLYTCGQNGLRIKDYRFKAPEHKEATYAQCLRNYAAALPLDEEETLCTSDVDMALFSIPEYLGGDKFSVFGCDLVPERQYPQCYITGKVKLWRDSFDLHGKTYQNAIDELLGEDECQDYRGCRWSVDQEQSFLKISQTMPNLIPRARPGTQFASLRCDRDNAYWRKDLTPDLVDAHLWRPLYEESNFNNLMELMQIMYPNDDFSWLIQYRNEYLQLL